MGGGGGGGGESAIMAILQTLLIMIHMKPHESEA